MRIRVSPKNVFPGIESKSAGIHEFTIGALADYLNPGDGIVLYTPNTDFSECNVFAVAEVNEVNPTADRCTLDIRLHSDLIRPDKAARYKWRDNPYLCLDRTKITKYELLNLFARAFNDDSWLERSIQDSSRSFAKFNLSKRTLLPVNGYVYLFKFNDAFKIGMSTTTARRKKEIERDKKLTLELLHEISSNDYQRAEATLHAEFAFCRRGKSELFDLSSADIDRILSIAEMDFPLP
jgi:hypothetical protein